MCDMFRGQLANCGCCPRKCGANRIQGQTGYCGIAGEARISHAGLHFGEEPPISGTRGSGTIFFAGCNLHCVFCQNYQISQAFENSAAREISTEELASEMLALEEQGAHNINFVSPSHVVFQIAGAVQAARGRGLTVPIIYNSNGYDSVESLRQIRGLVDVYMPDLKYLDNELAGQYSDAADYPEVAMSVLTEMHEQAGLLETDENGIAVSGMLVRHLVLPGHMENSRKCLEFLAGLSKDITVGIMSQYTPRYRAGEYPDINRALEAAEYTDITDYALSLGLDNALVQGLSSHRLFIPDFELQDPFER